MGEGEEDKREWMEYTRYFVAEAGRCGWWFQNRLSSLANGGRD